MKETKKVWGVALLVLPTALQAQIRTDGSVGPGAQTLSGPAYTINQTLGRVSGGNLFFSFSTFNINSGESATFTTTSAGINNVISRVTGGSPSLINGPLTLNAASGAPAFYFINPAGVTFGAGAVVDVPGAFHVSTANYLKFPDGNFYADTTRASTFSAADPVAFGFFGTTRAPIIVTDGADLTMKTQQALSLVAGDVEIGNDSWVRSEGGNIRILANGTRAQEVGVSGSLATGAGDVSLTYGGKVSASTASAVDGGKIEVSAGSLTLDDQSNGGGTGLYSLAKPGSSGNAGSVEVKVAGALTTSYGSEISVDTHGAGNAGTVKVEAASAVVRGSVSSDVVSGSGNGGSVELKVTGDLSLLGSGYVSASSNDAGNAGLVKVSAGNLTMSQSGIYADAMWGGQGGTVQVSSSGNVQVGNGSVIRAVSDDAGAAGSVDVRGRNVTVTGNSTIETSSWYDWGGPAGSLSVSASGTLRVDHGGKIAIEEPEYASPASTQPRLTVNAGNLVLDSSGSIYSLTRGNNTAAAIDVTVGGSASIARGAAIYSATTGAADAGAVTVRAGSLEIDGSGVPFSWVTGILSRAMSGGSGGNSGQVSVQVAGDLAVRNGGIISAQTDAAGNAGTVAVSAGGTLSLVNGGRINSITEGDGNAGTVRVQAGNIAIDGNGQSSNFTGISSSAVDQTGNAGSVEVTASGNLAVVNGGMILSATQTAGNGGTITVSAGSVTLDGRAYTGTTGLYATSLPAAAGDAGNINVTAGNLSVVGGAQISTATESASGRAGTINVQAGSVVVAGRDSNGVASSIAATAQAGSSGLTGNVTVSASDSITLADGGKLTIANFANVAAPGPATTLSVSAPRIALSNGGQISAAATDNADASNIAVNFSDRMTLNQASITTSANLGNGGAIDIRGGRLLALSDAQITTSVLGAGGNGGNIRIRAQALAMNTGFIQANTAAAGASGGEVNVEVQTLLPSGNSLIVGGATPYSFMPGIFGFNVIQAAAPTGVSGSINVAAPVLDLSGSLAALKLRALEQAAPSRNPCRTTAGSSFALAGRGFYPRPASSWFLPELALPDAPLRIGAAKSTDAALGCAKA